MLQKYQMLYLWKNLAQLTADQDVNRICIISVNLRFIKLIYQKLSVKNSKDTLILFCMFCFSKHAL